MSHDIHRMRATARTRRSLGSRLRRARTPLAVASVVILIGSGCGARLSASQMAALNGSDQVGAGAGTATGGSSVGSGSVGASTGSGTSGSSGSSGSTGTASSAAGSAGSGATAGTGSSSGSSGSTAAGAVAGAQGTGTGTGTGTASPGSSGSPGGSSNTPAGGASATATGGGSGAATSSGGQTVSQAGNPLAGVGGHMCASGAPGSGPGVTSSTITVGNIATVNGPVPGLFAGARYGAEAVAAYIDSIGGICGRKLVVNAADDQFDQATDQNDASSMANSVLAFMGSFSLQDAGIPAGAPNVPDVGESLAGARFNGPMNFSPQPEPPGYHIGEYEYLKSDPKYAAATQHMAALVENTPQTASEGAQEIAALKSVGYKFVFTDTTLQPTDPTFNGDVQKMKAAGVQGVIFEATGTIIGQLANAMYAAGINLVLGNWSPPAYDPAFLQNAGPGTAGTVISQPLALYDGEDAGQVPMVATLDQWYSRVDPGQVPDIYAVYSWMSGLLLAQAINTGGAPTRAALLAGLKQETSFTADGLAPPANPAAKSPPTCWLLIDVVNGKFVRDPVTPSGFKCSPAGYYYYKG